MTHVRRSMPEAQYAPKGCDKSAVLKSIASYFLDWQAKGIQFDPSLFKHTQRCTKTPTHLSSVSSCNRTTWTYCKYLCFVFFWNIRQNKPTLRKINCHKNTKLTKLLCAVPTCLHLERHVKTPLLRQKSKLHPGPANQRLCQPQQNAIAHPAK